MATEPDDIAAKPKIQANRKQFDLESAKGVDCKQRHMQTSVVEAAHIVLPLHDLKQWDCPYTKSCLSRCCVAYSLLSALLTAVAVHLPPSGLVMSA